MVVPRFNLRPAIFTLSPSTRQASSRPQLYPSPPTPAGNQRQQQPETQQPLAHFPQPPPTLQTRRPAPALTAMTHNRDNTKMLPLFRGDYSNKEDPAEWFALFRLATTSLTEKEKVTRFKCQLYPGGLAEEWFTDLDSSEKMNLADIKNAFGQRWPARRRPKWSRAQQRERIKDQVLRTEDIGRWIEEEQASDYGQNLWAERVVKLALSMGDANGFLIDDVLYQVPDLLKDHLTCEYNNWEEFLEAVRGIPANKLRRGQEELTKERTRDATMASLQQQLLHLSTWPAAAPVRTPVRAPPTAPSMLPSNPAMPYANLNTSPPGPWNRGAGPGRAPLTRNQIFEKAMAVPQRPNTEAGRRMYEVDVETWHRNFGTEAFPSLERPYPLKPGTATVGSGECFNCGVVTEPLHIGSTCTSTEPIRQQESRWRGLVASMLRRTMQARPPASAQYTWPVQAPNAYLQRAAPVLAINTFEGRTNLEAGYEGHGGHQSNAEDWNESENYWGLLPPTDQQ
ncbi:hypothetical protein EDD15DRAFT_2374870 [Pisolithus albus]|nr:hypothetical protein EDD15DRAFT_2374870 [Pisolithus albus]